MSINRQRGISYVELIIFMVIVGIALIGILSAMNLTTRNSSDPLVRKQALMLAEGFMEEVQLARFTFCDATDERVDEAKKPAIGTEDCATLVENVGNEAGGARPFDNINDYVAAYGTQAEAFNVNGALSDVSGQPLGLPGYSVRLTVRPTPMLGPEGLRLPNDEVLWIRVAVFFEGVETIVLDGYRARYAPNSPP